MKNNEQIDRKTSKTKQRIRENGTIENARSVIKKVMIKEIVKE